MSRTILVVCAGVFLICAVLVTTVTPIHLIIGAMPLYSFRIYVRIGGFKYLKRPVWKHLTIPSVMVGAAAGGVGDGGRWLGTVLCGIGFGCLGYAEGIRIEQQILDTEDRSEIVAGEENSD